MRDRYAMITVDTEALPKRASDDHVNRLIWGRFPKGTAGVAEMCKIGDEFGVKHVFFTDLCGAYSRLDELKEVVHWLDEQGQDVQLHTHPEYLPDSFWKEHGLSNRPQYMNQYTEQARAEFVFKHFAGLMSEVTGKPVLAHRAGSFRWNADTIRALKAVGIPLSFNNSVCAVHNNQCIYSKPTNNPFVWSNGVIEVPMTEKRILGKVGKPEWWARLTYPESSYFRFRPWWGQLLLNTLSGNPSFAVFLLHSWSLLFWDENGLGEYRDDSRMEGYRKLLARLTKDYDVITTAEFLDLKARGKIVVPDTVDLSLAELQAEPDNKIQKKA
ncbi:polysaccharide deacetylase [Providencia rettgeri]|nr:polysaccharide deacetylase [Providencia rettgeri]